jgi:bifunctional DNA-binding transcriptional regulator/antitoxin component of YhaV-PrlF toxin-antitoxin module
MSYLVGSKGQIVIAKQIRERLGVEPGAVALQRLVGDHVEVYFLPPEHTRSLKGSLRAYAQGKTIPPERWNEAREEAWKRAAREREGLPEE